MTYSIVKNTSRNVVLHMSATNTNIILLGNNSVSNVAVTGVTDAITGCTIKQIWYSADSGAGANGWRITRDAIVAWDTDSSGWIDFAGNGSALNVGRTAANVTFTRTGTHGTLMVEFQKEYAAGGVPSDSDY